MNGTGLVDLTSLSRFGLIYVDPPWSYRRCQADSWSGRLGENSPPFKFCGECGSSLASGSPDQRTRATNGPGRDIMPAQEIK